MSGRKLLMKILSMLARIFLPLFVCNLALAQIPTVGDGRPGPAKAPHLMVEVLSSELAVSPGDDIHAGLYFKLDPGWHVYWVNAGDSGEPPSIKWTLPEGITASPLRFPTPKRLPLGPLMDFGYEGEVLFPVNLHTTRYLHVGKGIQIPAHVDWLVCREVCIPGRANLVLELGTVSSHSITNNTNFELFRRLAVIPAPLPSTATLSVTQNQVGFVITLRMGARLASLEFYPFDADQIANAAPQIAEPLQNGVRLVVKKADTLTAMPSHLHGLLRLPDGSGYEIDAPVTASVLKPVYKPKQITIIAALLLAFGGGIILNLMPCVFPVLFLKGLALVHSSNEERGKLRMHGVMYTFGVLVSFWGIVGALLLLRASGSQFGWGFQLQSPAFIAVLASFLFFFALSLAGMFDVGLSITSTGDSLAQKGGYTGSFFTGVLATIVATPCTAPLMGAAIGFALAQPTAVTFLVFTVLALGLALPYLALSLHPAWVRLLPKPGVWMDILKQLTAIPLFATVIWLVWVYGRLFSNGATVGPAGGDSVGLLLLGFLVLAIAGWVLGRWPGKRPAAMVGLVIAAVALCIPLTHHKPSPVIWQAYSPEKMAQLRADGKPVFVDFTAAWCLSCQVNERLVLDSAEVQQRFRDKNVQLVRADWTQYDAGITKELGQLGRSGVPTYVIYPPGINSQPNVLPEVLTKDLVLKALDGIR